MKQHALARTGKKVALTAAATVLAAGMAVQTAPLAKAETNTPAGCIAEGQVWLLVVDDSGKELANQCVGTPATGTKALEAAKLDITRDGSNFICAIGGVPAKCPAKFNGQFWNYYQADAKGTFTFSQKGADESKPKPGSIEGWCYNKAGTKGCQMPKLDLTTAPAGAGDATATASSSAADQTSAQASASASSAAAPVTEEKKKSNTGMTILLVAAAVAGLLGLVLFGKKKAKN